VFIDRNEHQGPESLSLYVVRKVGGGFAVNVYFIDRDDLGLTPVPLGRGMSLRLLKFSGGSVDDYAICRSS
jgi:hypothetical protein